MALHSNRNSGHCSLSLAVERESRFLIQNEVGEMSTAVDERLDASRRYQYALASDDKTSHPCYAALGDACAKSELMIDLLVSVPLQQRNAMLIFAALHYQALRGHAQLAPLYGSLGGANCPSPEEFARRVIDIVSNDPTVVSALLTRSTQTNEPGRSAVFQAVLREMYRRGIDEVNLIDIGTSAGLNLYVDHYDIVRTPLRDDHDAFTLSYESLNSADLPGPLPTIRSRIGVDLSPLDLRNDDDAMWLRACLWPENPSRLDRLNAIGERLSDWPTLTLIQSDALDGLEKALELVNPDASTVVMHSWAAAYFDPELQKNFAERMRELVRLKRVSWVYLEWPRGVAGLQPPAPRDVAPRPGETQIVVALAGGEPQSWGWCHPHGRWLSLSPASGPKA